MIMASMFLASPALADEKAAETCLRTKVWDGYAEGWGIRTMTSTLLDAGATRNYLVTLYKGNEYQVQTCADKNVINLDVLLYDIDGNMVLRDETNDREPKLSYKPAATATYYIVLHARGLVEGKANAGIAMAVTYR
jgi:hypothetical protein